MADKQWNSDTETAEDAPTFYLRRGGCNGSGEETASGFLVHAGSVGRARTTASFETDTYKSQRDDLINLGLLVIEEDRVILAADHEFSSSSAAASVLMGRKAGGPEEWTHSSGITLREFNSGEVITAELRFRRRWFEAHRDRFAADEDRYREAIAATDGFADSAAEALALLGELRRTNDLHAFHEGMKAWAVKPGTLAFNGFSGQMMLNQLVNRTEEPQQLAVLLAESMAMPATIEDAVAKIRALVDYVERIRVGAHPGPGHVPFLLSYFWALADYERWPVIWASAAAFVEFATGEDLPADPPERYRLFLERVREFSAAHVEIETTAAWWHSESPVFMDEVLSERAEFGWDSTQTEVEDRMANARSLVAIASYWGEHLVDVVSSAIGRKMAIGRPDLHWAEGFPRSDLWVDWYTKEAPRLGIRVWLNPMGAAVALRPGEVRKGWWDEVEPFLEAADFPDCRVLGGASSRIGEDVGLSGLHGAEFVYGVWFDRDELKDVDLAATVTEISTVLRPLFEELLALANREASGGGTEPLPPNGGREYREEVLIEELADELLVDRGFLHEVIALLRDKGQVILYGPPGTGKTYLAKKLAEALAPDPSRRALVQFHPSSSYEDFFEGYRPVVTDRGDMTYRLTLGPLARMASKADEETGKRHVMIIDEINRANLPKVFGELLFLLEYRGESARTLYRPDDKFKLPKDLWFIGTMNTADRSIALIDAALRRRFHFIPFFPNRPPIEGLLERWIKRHHGEDAVWVWELVAQVNDELVEALRGPHLLLGPSHFMKENLDVASVRRIWQFNIEPFIEDQFFGDSQQIERFRFDAVYERYQELSGARDQSVQPPPADESVQAGDEGGEAKESA